MWCDWKDTESRHGRGEGEGAGGGEGGERERVTSNVFSQAL